MSAERRRLAGEDTWIERWAKVKFTFEGLHHYPDAPAEVEFLRQPHRHVFHVTIWLQQFHNERDVEYIMFKRWISACFQHIAPSPKSCETMCEDIAATIRTVDNYRDRRLRVEVLEDGENGALLEFD